MKIERILYINGGLMDQGGISSFMMNYYRNLDKSKFQIDFIVHGFEIGFFDEEIKSLGGRIFNIPKRSTSFFGNINNLKKIIDPKNYQIVHSNMDAMNLLVMKISKDKGIPIRISHSHNTQHITNNKIKKFILDILKKFINNYATHLFACSYDAGKWLYGKKIIEQGNVKIINNAIDFKKFSFDLSIRTKLRKLLNLEGFYVIGCVGRFDYQKNHLFLIEVIAILVKLKSNIKLILVGDGHLRGLIEKRVNDLNISDNVILLGSRSNIYELYNIFDFFILPSIFEGLGMVLIEAQANGLSCLASTKVPAESNILNKIIFLDLEKGSKYWADIIFNIINYDNNRIVEKSVFDSTGYSIDIEAKKLSSIYINLLLNLKK
jgi:glycosyltransferase involved in cell wall biosynthesis